MKGEEIIKMFSGVFVAFFSFMVILVGGVTIIDKLIKKLALLVGPENMPLIGTGMFMVIIIVALIAIYTPLFKKGE